MLSKSMVYVRVTTGIGSCIVLILNPFDKMSVVIVSRVSEVLLFDIQVCVGIWKYLLSCQK